MKSFRERLGIRQDFDNWSKGINNTLSNLRKQGFENEAQQNIDYLKAQGYQFRQDKNGNEVLSRAGENKQNYKGSTQQETEQIKKDLWNVKKAKESKKKPPKPPIPPIDDFYNLCEIVAEEVNKIAGAHLYSPKDIIDKFKADNVRGSWENAANIYIEKAQEYIQEFEDYYSSLKNTYDDDYIDL